MRLRGEPIGGFWMEIAFICSNSAGGAACSESCERRKSGETGLHRGNLFCQEQCLEVLCEVAGPDMSRERPRTRRASILQWRTLLPKKGAVGFRRVVLRQDHQRGSFTISGGIEFEAVGGFPPLGRVEKHRLLPGEA